LFDCKLRHKRLTEAEGTTTFAAVRSTFSGMEMISVLYHNNSKHLTQFIILIMNGFGIAELGLASELL